MKESTENKLPFKIDLYFIPEFSWVFLLYYFGINAFLSTQFVQDIVNFFSHSSEWVDIYSFFPTVIVEYNDKLMGIIEQWILFIGACSIAMLVCGVLFSLIARLKIFSGDKTVGRYASYGIFFGKWGLLSVLLYLIYIWFGNWYVLAIFAIAFIVHFLEYYRIEVKLLFEKILITIVDFLGRLIFRNKYE